MIAPGTRFEINDEVDATNTYHFIPLGLSFSGNCGRFIWNVRGDVGLGIVNQRVDVRGQTDAYVNDLLDSREDGGFLALHTYSGRHKRTRFAWLPQGSVDLRRALGDHLSLHGGYTVMFLTDAVKAVDHVPTVIDPDNLPTPTPGAGPDPRFAFKDNFLLVHGFHFGLQLAY